jgi:hypothetical protein
MLLQERQGQRENSMRVPLFGKKKLLLAFEYGMILAKTAHENGFVITHEFMEKAEVMIEGEFSTQSATQLSVDMAANILSTFELDLYK